MEEGGDSSWIAVLHRHEAVDGSIRTLQRTGFEMKKLSIPGRDWPAEEHAVGICDAGDRVRCWGERRAFWGAIFDEVFA
jgi:hypothetical protein